jgi:hypothetical protein
MRTDPPYVRTFVVQLGPGTDLGAGRLEGRIDHLASTRSARFGSVDELLAAMANLMAEAPRPAPKCKDQP